MKTNTFNLAIGKVAALLLLLFISFSCKKDVSNSTKLQSSNASSVTSSSDIPPYNLDVALNGDGKGVGLLKFRQNKDAAKIIDLNTWVWHLQPNHPYMLQRAVDSIKFGGCFSTSWLTLGLGLVPQSIRTDASGNGHADLWRDISLISSGTEFYIHFQVIDSVSSAVTLTSDCYTYTVR